MTPCEYRHDCWHEDTCCASESPLVKPGCWKEKGEGWRSEPDSVLSECIKSVADRLSNMPSGEFKKLVNSVVDSGMIIQPEPYTPKEADQGELF